jgi:energy-coupling factor transporter ATP-binding protein EcfA2
MILSAIYLEEHILIDNPVLINLGGNYIYELKENTIFKHENKNYIKNFYSKETIRLLTAIVGKNGAGKSTLVERLINIINNQYGYNSALIFEDGDKILVKQRSNVGFEFQYEIFHIELTTFYYSPYLDFKIDRGGFDLSLDNTLDKDLNNINEIRKSSDRVNPVQHLKMRTWIRQMEFINSDIGKIFAKYFDLPVNGLNKITFTRHMIEVDYEQDQINFHNTPYGFREVIQFIYDKVKHEAKEINANRPKGFSLVLLQKEMLKNYFLMDFICLFIVQMEKQNSYLSEGFLEIETKDFIKKHKQSNSLDAFFDFLDKHFYKLNANKFTLLPIKESKNLINEVFNYIDISEAKDDRDNRFFEWHEKAIYLNEEQAINLINLQNQFLDKVDNYYRKSIDSILDLKYFESSRIKDFINFQPSKRSLSSGENSLLNLFSRFHEVFEKELALVSKSSLTPLSLVFLDEADLGFHPKWKKEFVKFILMFFNQYFNKLKTHAQIIFTTHDALALSDILNYNVIYLDKKNPNFSINNELRPNKSFGANISDLLADSFFVGDGLIGEFASFKIDETIKWLNDDLDKNNPNYYKLLIENIGEPIIKHKLAEMYSEKMKDDLAKRLLKEEIDRLSDKYKRM